MNQIFLQVHKCFTQCHVQKYFNKSHGYFTWHKLIPALYFTINSLNAMGTFMCPYKIGKNMYFILTPNIKRPIQIHISLMDVLKLGWEKVKTQYGGKAIIMYLIVYISCGVRVHRLDFSGLLHSQHHQ